MKCFAIQDDQVLIMEEIFCIVREVTREGLRKQLNTQWVWWEDEIGTLHDPIRGPFPQFGPKAMNRDQ